MDILVSLLRVIHILTAVLMAWPFYALVAVNNRARLGPPLGDRADAYMEGIIKNRTIPCFVFQATALLSGLALITLRGMGLGVLFTNAALGVKFLLLVLIAVLLSYVHLSVQPAIDRLFAQGNPLPPEAAKQIGALRLQRKRIASVCLFSVLTMVLLGIQVWAPFPLWLTAALIAAVGLFTWRAFRSLTPFGWM